MTTTTRTITVTQIEALRDESGQAGDLAMVAICDRALRGTLPESLSRDRRAIAECARVIAEAEAAAVTKAVR